MIPRPALRAAVLRALSRSPVVALLGPRQAGKTTLAREIARARPGDYLDLEDPEDRRRLAAPMAALRDLRGLVVLDEIQRRPELYEILRVLADRRPVRARFLVLGSASPGLVRGVSETLAGRVRLLDMGPFDLSEAGVEDFRRLWLRGGFPPSYLAPSDGESLEWRRSFVRTFLERDVPQLGISIPSAALARFWAMVAHFHGQVWNAAEFARSLGTSEPTARRHLDLLTGAYMVRQLQPWHENIGKRQVKSPKIYIRDSGLLHALLELRSRRDLERHVKLGASFEGFVIEQVLSLLGTADAYCWGTHAGAELDLLVIRDGRRLGFEVKYADAPGLTKSMHIAIEDLGLDRLFVVHPGTKSYHLAPKVEALAVRDLPAVSTPRRRRS